jgi:hypothetical protein
MAEYVVTAPNTEEMFKKWLARGDGVGVFENADLGHPEVGRLVFAPVTPDEEKKVRIGQTSLPDGPYGMGWRYLLQAVSKSLTDFEFKPEPEAPPKKRRRSR